MSSDPNRGLEELLQSVLEMMRAKGKPK